MTKGSSKADAESRKKGGKRLLIAAMSVIIVVLVAVIVVLLKGNIGKNDDSTDKPKRNVVVNEKNAEEIASGMISGKNTPIGSYEVTMNTTWNFKNGKSASDNAYVKNAKSNTNSVYFDVVRSDTGETILESPILPVGAYLESLTLDKELTEGTYECVCTYHLIDEDDKPISKVNVGLQIVINN